NPDPIKLGLGQFSMQTPGQFSVQTNTYHHWRVFAPTSSGVRITFDEQHLQPSISGVPDLQMKEVEYVKISDIRSTPIDRHSLPFLKRYPYSQESEVRLLWQSREERASFELPINLQAIQRITLSPWLHPALHQSVKAILHSIDGCSSLRIHG
uniref:DUF2971 domain-containing protein n=1 Tax=Achromobacter sp. GbtcB20 TaxID=2824765 RepID=UPI001C3109F8